MHVSLRCQVGKLRILEAVLGPFEAWLMYMHACQWLASQALQATAAAADLHSQHAHWPSCLLPCAWSHREHPSSLRQKRQQRRLSRHSLVLMLQGRLLAPLLAPWPSWSGQQPMRQRMLLPDLVAADVPDARLLHSDRLNVQHCQIRQNAAHSGPMEAPVRKFHASMFVDDGQEGQGGPTVDQLLLPTGAALAKADCLLPAAAPRKLQLRLPASREAGAEG